MNITLNGNRQEISDGATVRTLLDFLKLKPETVAVELNLEIVPKKDYDSRKLNESDKVEVISFVGGG